LNYRRLGGAGVKISEVSLGGWLTFGNTLGVDDVKRIVGAAVEGGVNFIDLADIYAHGRAEETFGAALKDYPRQDLVVSSKVFWPMSDNPNDGGLSRKHIMASIDGSLKRIGTDYVDIYFCHRYDRDVSVEEVVRTMDDLIRQGKVHYWGTSMWPTERIMEANEVARRLGAHAPTVEQPRYNMLDRRIEVEVMPAARQYGLGLVVWSPLEQGILTGKYVGGIPDDSRGARHNWGNKAQREHQIETARRLQPVADDLGVPLSQLALAWCLRRPEVTSVITGATKVRHVEENLEAVDIELDDDVLARIEEILDNKPEMPEL
jgi:voltage-dependent potassium channel beta subunit